MKQRLLICADWFDPGVRAGGPVRSCVNLVSLLAAECDVAVLTSNRDLGAPGPYEGIPADRWLSWRGLARVRYCRSPLQRMFQFVATLHRWKPDTVYLNSMFSVAGTIGPLLYVFLFRHPARMVLAPRGMLKGSALSQKAWKKRPLLKLLRRLRLVSRITFHATSAEEVQEIRSAFGAVEVILVSNVPCVPLSKPPARVKEPGCLNLCFLGRVHPIKNLLWLLDAMATLKCECRLTIVGPIEDQQYYDQCQRAVNRLPSEIAVDFVGVKTEAEVRELLVAADAMILPTQGENFGHAIFESLAVGTPVIISDQTIWRDLSNQKAGWDLPLVPEAFATAISELARMTHEEYGELRRGALGLAHRFQASSNFLMDYRQLFAPALDVDNVSPGAAAEA